MGYADDTTLLSASPEDHQTALRQVDSKCSDLGLEIRPDKCVSYDFDGRKMNSHSQTIGANPTNTKLHAGKKLTERVYTALNEIDQRPIRGEYKAWIYKFYLVPSLLFNLTVYHIPQSTIKKIQTRATSVLKRWLRIPRCATLASIFHPDVTTFPTYPMSRKRPN